MKICIAGWYFRPNFMHAVRDSDYPAYVVKHREGDTFGIASRLYGNQGLEFGAYRQFVENRWDGKEDVFFCHDDIAVSDKWAFNDVERLAGMGVDQADLEQSARVGTGPTGIADHARISS